MASNPLARALKARGKKIPGGEDTNQLPGERANFFYNRAKLLYKEGGNCSIILERVTATIIKAIGLSPLEIKYFLFLAKVFHAALDFASCVYCLRYVLKVSPHHLVARKRLSIVLFQMGQESLCEALVAKNRGKPLFTKAKAYFEECMKHDVLNKRLWILKSICHIYLNELDQAYEAVKRVIRPNKPVPAELYILRAKILWAQGLTAQGNQDLTIAKTIDPRHPEVAAFSTRIFIESEKLFHRCLDFIEEGDYGSALKAVKHAMSIARDDIKLHCLVAKIYRLSGDVQAAFAAIQQATTMFRQATSSDVFDMDLPDDIVLQTNLIFNDMAIGFAQQGDYQRSIALLNKIIESERERCARKAAQAMDVRYLINRADCYRAIGRSVDAVRDYSEALSVKPNDVQVKTRLSLTLYTEAVEAFNRSDFSTCEKLFCDAIELNANVSEYYLNRGKARYYLAKFSEAYSDFKMAQKLNPTNDEITAQLRQFMEERSMLQTGLVDSKEDADNILLSSSTSASALLQQQLMKGTVSAAANIAVTKADMVHSLLNQKAARRLPSLAQSAKEIEEALLQKGPRLPPPKPSELMAAVNPRLLAPMIAAVESQSKEKTVKAILHAKRDTEKSSLWNMLNYASDMANRQNMNKSLSAGKEKMGAVSASALKRQSEQQSKKNKNAPIAGVFSDHRGADPLTARRSLSLRLKIDIPSANVGDDVSTMSRSTNAESTNTGTHSQSQAAAKASLFSHASFGITPGHTDDVYATRLIIKGPDGRETSRSAAAVASGGLTGRRKSGMRRGNSFRNQQRQQQDSDMDDELSQSTAEGPYKRKHSSKNVTIVDPSISGGATADVVSGTSSRDGCDNNNYGSRDGSNYNADDEFIIDGNTKTTRSGLVKLLLDSGISGMWPLRPIAAAEDVPLNMDILSDNQPSYASDEAKIERILASRTPPQSSSAGSEPMTPNSLARVKSFAAAPVLRELENEDDADY